MAQSSAKKWHTPHTKYARICLAEVHTLILRTQIDVFGHIGASIKVNLAIFLAFCIVSSFGITLTNVGGIN